MAIDRKRMWDIDRAEVRDLPIAITPPPFETIVQERNFTKEKLYGKLPDTTKPMATHPWAKNRRLVKGAHVPVKTKVG